MNSWLLAAFCGKYENAYHLLIYLFFVISPKSEHMRIFSDCSIYIIRESCQIKYDTSKQWLQLQCPASYLNLSTQPFWVNAFIFQKEHRKFHPSMTMLHIRPVNFLGFSSFAQNQNFSQKFWAKTQNLPKLQMYEFLT